MKYYPICDDCIKGKGGECHTPGCIYCYNDVPPEVPEAVSSVLGIDLDEHDELLRKETEEIMFVKP